MREPAPPRLAAALPALLLVLSVPLASPSAPAAAPAGDTALAAFVAGSCTARPDAASAPVALRVLDRLARGARIETGPDARLVVVFLTGERFELGPGSSASIATSGLSETRGSVRGLPPVSPRVTLAPLAAPLEVSRRAGAVRVRGDDRLPMYPCESAAVAPGDAVLRFAPVAGADRYSVAVEDEAGNTVFSAQTGSTRVVLPQAVLKDGAAYFWRVRARGPGLSGTGREERFVTLSPEEGRRWAEARANLAPEDPSLRALLAATASSLGLRREACLAAVPSAGAPADPWASSLGCEALAPFLSPD